MFAFPDLKPDEIIIYLRKSRTDDPSMSVADVVEKHEQMLDEWSIRNIGEKIPEQNRFREIVSGETIAARPEIQKVLRLIEQPRYKAILIVEPQRLSRGDLEDIGRISKILRFTNTIVITLQYSYDLTDERDRDYFERELKRGNDYLEYSKRIMANGRVLSTQNGNYIGSIPPYGYKRIKYKSGTKYIHTLEIVPDEAEIVRQIFLMYESGKGATSICRYLNQFCKPQRNKQWTPSTIYIMLDNPLYNGKTKWQARIITTEIENGELVHHNPRNKGYKTFNGKHDAIIPDALWDAVRMRREARNTPRTHSTRTLQNPLSGLIYCKCGYMMIRRPHKKGADRLQCQNQAVCGNASCTMDDAITLVCDILKQSIFDFQIKVESGADAQSAEKAAFVEQLNTKLIAVKEKELRLWEKYADGMPKSIFDSLLSEVQDDKANIEKLISESEEEKPIQYAELLSSFHAALECLKSDKSAAEKNSLLKSCIKKITYSREKGSRHKLSGGKGWDMMPISVEIELNL